MHVQIVLFDGFDLMDALAPYEAFAAAGMFADGAITAELVSAEGERDVPSGMGGPRIRAAGPLDPGRSGVILVPGASGGVTGGGPDAVVALLQRASQTKLTPLVREALGKPGMTIATVCGGSLLLAMSGMLEGRYAVTNRLGMDALGATGAIPVNARVVDDGDLVSGGGVTSGLDAALHLIERELGPRIAHAVERLFEYERRGTVWRASGLAPAAEDREETEDGEAGLEPEPLRQPPAGEPDGGVAAFEGVWRVVIATPVGKLNATFTIASDEHGRLRGIADQDGEAAPFIEPAVEGGRLVWRLQATKPMRLNLRFQVAAAGGRMTGTAKAGMLPASKVTGERITNAPRGRPTQA